MTTSQIHFAPTANLTACGHPSTDPRGPNGECMHNDHFRARR